jgi:hypothetical protein
MRIDRIVALAALPGAIAVGVASPAWSEEFAGMYSVTRSGVYDSGTAPMMWTVIPCGSGCRQIVGDNSVKWDAHLVDGQWRATLHRPDAVDCRNGTFAAGTSEFSLDAETLRGTIVGTSDGPACGSPMPVTEEPSFSS